MQTYVASRIPTARLLDEAWAACQAEEKNVMRASVLGQIDDKTEPTAPDLESLDDAEVERLYRETRRKIASDSRRLIVADFGA